MALPTLTTPLPPSPCPSLQSWLSSEVSPKPSSTALACPGQPHVWPRLGVGHWGIQAEKLLRTAQNLCSKDIFMKWLVNWRCGTFGGKCIKFRLQGSSGTQIQAGDFLGDTLILTVQERLLVSDPRGCSWTQAMGPSWRGQCPHLIIASCGVHQTHSHCKPWILQADSKSMWLPSATKTHSYRTFRQAWTQTAVTTRSWSWPPHSYTHTHTHTRTCTHTHTHTHTHTSQPPLLALPHFPDL